MGVLRNQEMYPITPYNPLATATPSKAVMFGYTPGGKVYRVPTQKQNLVGHPAHDGSVESVPVLVGRE